jgi:hypothetical protein
MGTTFDVRVLSHLVTHTIALQFEIPGLAVLVADSFETAFVQFCTTSPDDKVEAALKKCFSREFLGDCGLGDESVTLLLIVAFSEFKQRVRAYKRDGRFEEALKLMEELPSATAELYSQPVRVGCEADEDKRL